MVRTMLCGTSEVIFVLLLLIVRVCMYHAVVHIIDGHGVMLLLLPSYDALQAGAVYVCTRSAVTDINTWYVLILKLIPVLIVIPCTMY